MSDDGLMVLTAADVASLLAGEEATILDVVEAAYRTHGRGDSVLPHSCFLHLPGGRERIIALPAHLGGEFAVAGMKWIASFPGNVVHGRPRASGLVVLNSLATGEPRAIVEGSIVSAQRTAASAALAARVLHGTASPATLGCVGAGAINLETLRFLLHGWPEVERVLVYDLHAARAEAFVARATTMAPRVSVQVAGHWRRVMAESALVAIATTATKPYLDELGAGALRTVLHLSLRDLTPAVVLAADNVVDDVEHVCRADTSLHLAQQTTGGRAFIRCALADVLAGAQPPRRSYGALTIFSPFGLGILDIAVAKLVCDRAETRGVGTRIPFAAAAA
jgi:ornithine cyclodeaminase